ncbi:MAG TPA: peptidoglycan-binding domain-containing protein [Candidatus Limiplasma sp.]|nr:peptidoglycan-binding domain-containing protein [Candidatus Limiplasma sp.]HRX09887.1 peptidoglycan-binding domain-containing protein [Candidatus Limiplasma sp.]
MDLLKTILLYMSMLYVSAVQVAPDPATVNITPSPLPTTTGIYATAVVATPTPAPMPTPSITANPAYKTLVLGDRNATVGSVQTKLQELGYYTGEIDNAYGNQTRLAVQQFQYYNGLTVDGIAGRHTQTILFEYADVKAAPTPTPAFQPDETITPPPVTATPAPQPSQTPMEATEEPQPTDTPAPTETPDVNAPALLTQYSFEFSGFSQPLTVGDTETVLHPVELDEVLYVPLTEILQNSGNVIIENTNENLEEIAFNVLADFYQVSYTVNDDGSLANLVFEKNAQPQPLFNRSAILLDGVFYLPMEDMTRITGISFAVDDAAGIVTVTMPGSGT